MKDCNILHDKVAAPLQRAIWERRVSGRAREHWLVLLALAKAMKDQKS